MKLKKRKKTGRMRGRGMGGHGWGARKKHQGSGHRGGFGMAGTGKRADQKKTLVIKLYGNKYFGKQGITSKATKKRINKVMNIEYISKNKDRLIKDYGNKEGIIELNDYKILGQGEIKEKATIKAKSASKSAIEKIASAGGKIILPEKKNAEKDKEEKNSDKKEEAKKEE